jgi:hypothetical protein
VRQKTRLKASFVITIAGSVAQSAACGGTVADTGGGDTSSTGGSAESGGAPIHTGGRAESGGSPTHTGGVSIGGSGGTGNVPIINPPEPVVTECPDRQTYAPVSCPPAGQCTETLVCASQPKTFTLDCDTTRGYSLNEACDLPYDHCTKPAKPWDGADCLNGRWQLLGVGGNPPAPCPAEAPAVGQSCRSGASFGADREHCGYRCPDGTGWTVLSCAETGAPPDPSGVVPFAWQSDGACGSPAGTPK